MGARSGWAVSNPVTPVAAMLKDQRKEDYLRLDKAGEMVGKEIGLSSNKISKL